MLRVAAKAFALASSLRGSPMAIGVHATLDAGGGCLFLSLVSAVMGGGRVFSLGPAALGLASIYLGVGVWKIF